jgi:hypothetical protein
MVLSETQGKTWVWGMTLNTNMVIIARYGHWFSNREYIAVMCNRGRNIYTIFFT